jgi:hypothetical protein
MSSSEDLVELPKKAFAWMAEEKKWCEVTVTHYVDAETRTRNSLQKGGPVRRRGMFKYWFSTTGPGKKKKVIDYFSEDDDSVVFPVEEEEEEEEEEEKPKPTRVTSTRQRRYRVSRVRRYKRLTASTDVQTILVRTDVQTILVDK